MSKKYKSIAITTMPVSVPAEEAFDCAIKDRDLIDSICKYSDKLRGEGVEVFKRVDNVIATEKGYFVAWYEEDLRMMEGGIDNPTPFKGKDGRMKVNIKTEHGKWVIQDLATIVAMAFCPNPKKYTKVYFKDANPENCNGDNLYWVSDAKLQLLTALKSIGIKIKKRN